MIGEEAVTETLTANDITVLSNSCLPIERAGSHFWLSWVHDPVVGCPRSDAAIPPSLRNLPHEPVVLMCHALDYVDELLTLPSCRAVALMLCGHTHGGEVRLPLIGPPGSSPPGPKVCRRLVSLQPHATPRQSRHRHRRYPLPARLPAADHAAHAAFCLNVGRETSVPHHLYSFIVKRVGDHAPMRSRQRQAPAMVIPSMRSVGAATEPRNTRSLPMAVTPRSISARFPAIVTSSTACVSWPFSIHRPVAPRE